jgi:two-component system chemotaxis response regulator CheY
MIEQTALKVLIVDDYDMTRSLLKIILRGQKFNVVGEATDGEEGVEMCAKLQPDIVLLDVIMPKLNGLEALAKIKAQSSQAMVLMVSSAEDKEIVQEALKLGASGFVSKPFNTESVIETLNKARSAFTVRSSAVVTRKI